MPINLSAARSRLLQTDNDGDGVADPGDVFFHTLIITNNGDEDALLVEVDETENGYTIDPGSVLIGPIAMDDVFNDLQGNTPITFTKAQLIGNDIDPDGAEANLTVVIDTGSAVNGTIVDNGDDTYTFTPTTGFEGNATFEYGLVDEDGVTSVEATPGLVTIEIENLVWYVDSSSGSDALGDGSYAKPFASVNPLTTSGSADGLDGQDDIIFLYGGSAVSGNLVLENGQKLYGDSVAFSVNGIAIGETTGNSDLNGSGAFTVTLASGNEINGIDIGGVGGITGTNFGTFTVSNSTIDTTGQAISLNNGTLASGSAFTSTDSDGGTSNVSFVTVNGSLNLGSGALANATTGANVSVNGGGLNLTYNGTITQSQNASTVLVTNGHNGTLDFNGNVSATNGAGLQFNNADGTYRFDGGANSLNGGTAGIDILNGSNGTFVFDNLALDHSGNAGDAFVLQGSNANVTLNGTITDNSGRALNIDDHDGGTITINSTIASTSQGILVTDSAGTINFNGQIQLSTGIANALTMTNNTGATFTFAPGGLGLDITTTSGRGIFIEGGGTVTITGTGNTINSGSGTALDVSGTTIGAADLNFQSISSNGAVNGIVLENTGTSGGLNITGTGAANSGGTIQNSTGDAIVLTNTANFNASHITINQIAGHGINALNLSGTNSISNSVIQNWDTGNTATKDGIRIVNTVNSTMNMTVSDTAFTGSTTPAGGERPNDGIFMEAQSTSGGIMGLKVENSTFTSMFGDGIQVSGITGANATVNLRIINNDFTNAMPVVSPGVGGGNGGISLTPFGNINLFADIDGNEFRDIMRPISNLGAINMTNGLTADADVTIRNNILKDIDGSRGISVSTDGNSITRLNIDNNSLDDLGSNHGGFVINVNDSAQVDAIINNNRIGQDPAIAGRLWTTGATANHAVQIQALEDNSLVRVTLSNNVISANSSSVIEVVRFRAADSDTDGIVPTIHATVTGNSITDTDGTRVELDFTAGNSTNQGGIINSSITGNNVNGGVIQFNERTLGDLNVVQTSAANVSSLNNGATVNTISGSPDFSQPPPQSPTAPTVPVSPILAESPPPAGDGGTGDTTGDDQGFGGDPKGDEKTTTPEPEEPAPTGVFALTQAQLDAIVEAAIERWAEAGATPEQLDAMRAATISVADMTGLYLAASGAGTIQIDNDGAGHGWFVDSTPGEDSEFDGSGNPLSADSDGPAAGHMDLLTVVMHELGHQVGLDDIYDSGEADELMYGYARLGERRLPEADDLVNADMSHAGHEAYTLTIPTVGTLPAGKAVRILFESTVNNFSNQLIPIFQNFSTVRYEDSLSQDFSITSANESLEVDGLTLGNLVFLDANANGVFDAGDTGIEGVSLTLYHDTNGNGVYDDGVDQYIGYNEVNGTPGFQPDEDTPAAPGTGTALSVTTDVNGAYSFDSLAPGDYIVRATVTNFLSGGALEGLTVTATAADPDDNVDGDNNADGFTGYAATRAITLDYNTEGPNFDPGGVSGDDTNDTLDLGFVQPNQPPVIANLDTNNVDYTENDGFTQVDLGNDVDITDPDSGDFDGGSLTITVAGLIAGDEIRFNSNVFIDVDNGDEVEVGGVAIGTLTVLPTGWRIDFNSDATPDRVETVMKAVEYRNTTDDPSGTRTFTWTLVDGDGTANGGDDDATVTSTVTILAVNDPPVGANKTIAIDEDGSHTFAAADFGFSDPLDGDAFAAVEIVTLPALGTLTLDGNAVTAGQEIAVADIGLLVYAPAANGEGDDYATFTFKVIDDGGTANGGVDKDPNADTITFDVAAINDAPTSTGLDGDSVTFTEGDGAVLLDSGSDATIADVDSTDFNGGSLTVAISAGFVSGEDALGIDDSGAVTLSADLSVGSEISVNGSPIGIISSVQDDAITIDFNGNATQVRVGTLVRAFNYANTGGDDPTDGDRTISWTLVDGGGVANGGVDTLNLSTTVDVDPVNDEPAGDNATIVIDEDGSHTFAAGDFGFTDPAEGDAFAGVLITTLPANGELTLNGSTFAGGTFVTAADIASGLLVFTPDADENGDDYATFTFQVRDDGGTADGGQDTDQDPDTITFDVTSINDAPVLMVSAEKLFFNAFDGALGREMWVTDGTPAGTMLFKDIAAGSVFSSGPSQFTQLGDQILFAAYDPSHGKELWVSDGTADGTVLLKDIAPGSFFQGSPADFTRLGDKLVFRAFDNDLGTELWVTDGTADGTMLLKDIESAGGSAPSEFTQLGDKLVFEAFDSVNGRELWVTDGTTEGTMLLKDISPTSSLPAELTLFGDKVLFRANDGTHGAELWVTDGTPDGTMLLKDIAPGSGFGFPTEFTQLGDKMLFQANDGVNGTELWVTDGTEAGTMLLKNLTSNAGSSIPNGFTQLGDKLLFQANAENKGRELWVTDGTAEGTMLLKDLNPTGHGNPGHFGRLGDKLLFQADDGVNGAELWVTDGTAEGTMLLKDLNPGAAGSSPTSFSQVGDKLVFRADDGVNGVELWVTDGTAAGTMLLQDINPGSAASDPQHFGVLDLTPSYIEEGAPVEAAAQLELADDDANLVSAAVTIDAGFIANEDSLTIGGLTSGTTGTGGAISFSYDAATGVMTLSGAASVADYQAALRQVAFSSSSDAPGTIRTIQWVVNDGSEEANGTTTLDILPVNDAPEGANKTVTASEDDPYAFTLADFGFTDPADGNGFQAVRIATLPVEGQLLLNGVGVSVGDFVDAADISGGLLTFQPDADEFASPYASFTFQVRDDGGTANGGVDLDPTPRTMTIDVTPDNLAPVAQDDDVATDEDAVLVGSVFDDNGNGADADPDANETLVVADVNGNAADVDTTVLLPSGALLTLNADGTFSYDPNGQFGYLITAGLAATTGAVNDAFVDTFTYTLDNGNTATVTVTINGVESAGDELRGDSGDNVINGTAAGHFFRLDQGGDDAATGLGGVDIFAFGDTFTELDAVDGGDGFDELRLFGDYSGVVTFDPGTMVNVERILLGGGFSYGLWTDDANVAAGATLTVDGRGLGPLESLTFVGMDETNGRFILLGGGCDDLLAGGAGDDVLIGGAGNNLLAGEGGIDTLDYSAAPGAVNVDLGIQLASDNGFGGEDDLFDIENVIGTFFDDIIVGNAAANLLKGDGGIDDLSGGAGNDVLNGGAGPDTMRGGADDDTYVVDDSGDLVIENAGEGLDKVFSTVSHTLTDHVEILRLLGGADIDGTGNDLDNFIAGNAGANLLIGKGGNDIMKGEAGDDTYYVTEAGDQAVEVRASDGFDKVFSNVSYTIGRHIENLRLVGNAAIDATGNDLANFIGGNSGDNVLNGKGGADVMKGYQGDDTYYVNDAGDQAIEVRAGDGFDKVLSTVSFTLGSHVENLRLVGGGAVDGTGNELANFIGGNNAANVLDGRLGADILKGEAGDDTYIVDNAGDQVIEYRADHGTDTVQSSIGYKLGAFVENLTLTGSDAIDGTGNGLANTIVGNGAANVLNGRGGADVLQGGDGADKFLFDSALGGGNVDTVLDAVSGVDGFLLDNAVFTGLAEGALAANAFTVGSSATTADHRIIYDPTTGALFFDADGSGAGAAVQFATLDNQPATLSSSDFAVI